MQEIVVRVVLEREKTLSDKYPKLPPGLRVSSGPGTKTRKKVRNRDELCCWCKKNRATTVDHIFPISRGGKNTLRNLVGSCQPCNAFKGDNLPKEIGMKLFVPLRFFDYV